MGVTERIWGALTWMIKLEDKVVPQGEAMKAQQAKVEISPSASSAWKRPLSFCCMRTSASNSSRAARE
jgi:hypothetical protein